jgi:spore germination protein YaaH
MHMQVIRAVIYASSIFLLNACLNPTAEQVLRAARIGGWVTYWDFTNGMATVESAPGLFDDVFFFVAHLDGDGRIVLHRRVSEEQLRVSVERLSKQNIHAWLTVVNDVPDVEKADMVLKDAAVIKRVLDTDEARRVHVDALVSMLRAYGFFGIDIDYENLPNQYRTTFSQFARELAAATHAANLQMSITVQPKKHETNSVGAGAMDWKVLCVAADRMQIMLYNEHNAKTSPGPMATSAWVGQIFDYALTQCPREKLVPVFKVSGMVWGGGSVKGIQFTDVIKLRQDKQVDAGTERRAETPYFSYLDGDVSYTVYYEDAASLAAKLYSIARYRVDAVVFWSLGRHDPALVRQLSELRARASEK